MFNTTGQVHFSGIKNEHETIKLLNEWAIYPDTVTHLGGTKQKEDAEAGKQGISIKHKKGPVSYTHLTLPTIYSV